MFTLTLSQDHLQVEPGSAVSLTFTIRNDSDTPERAEIAVQGLDGDWVAIPMPVIPLAPGEEREDKILIKPPRAAESRSGAYPFVVQVRSLETGEGVEAQAVLELLPINLVSLQVEPKRASAGFFHKEAPFVVTAVNLGNTDQNLQLFADDPIDACTYSLEPERISLAPGQQREVRLFAQPRSTPLVGSSQLYGATVTARNVEDPKVSATAQAQVERRALLSPALLLMLLVIGTLGGFWFAMRPKPPVMESFDVDPVEIIVGNDAKLTWTTSNARSVTIETADGIFMEGLPASGSKIVKIMKPTTFFAFAVNEMGRSRTPREVTVVAKIVPKPPPAQIVSFEVDPNSVNLGQTATIKYKVANATKVTLQPLGVDLPVSGTDSYTFIAEAPGKMTLLLTAYNAQNQAVEKSVTLNVVDQTDARILIFRATVNGERLGTTEIAPGTPVQIEWQVTNAARIEVSPPIGISSDRGTLELLAPETTTTYTLTATDSKNRKATERIKISVVKTSSPVPPIGPGG
ncbi:MAG: hypothetical protein M3R13_03280 [Armatimonadota bacterium]|nr:hypothetical protein [Armatimonadota bacterium]